MNHAPHVEKKPVPAVIITVSGARIEGMVYVPLEERLIDELALPLRPYVAVGEPRITLPGSETTVTPTVAFVPKEQVQLAWVVEEP